MIVRVFRVRIHKEFQQDFENDIDLISLPLVKAQKGFVSVSFGRVLGQDNDEYVLITTWESQDALIAFCGEAWEQALIPHGMEKYIKDCWVYHYEQFREA